MTNPIIARFVAEQTEQNARTVFCVRELWPDYKVNSTFELYCEDGLLHDGDDIKKFTTLADACKAAGKEVLYALGDD